MLVTDTASVSAVAALSRSGSDQVSFVWCVECARSCAVCAECAIDRCVCVFDCYSMSLCVYGSGRSAVSGLGLAVARPERVFAGCRTVHRRSDHAHRHRPQCSVAALTCALWLCTATERTPNLRLRRASVTYILLHTHVHTDYRFTVEWHCTPLSFVFSHQTAGRQYTTIHMQILSTCEVCSF